MRLLVSSLLGCLCLTCAHAAEIVAWKIPFHKVGQYLTEVKDLKAIKSAPEPSVFFHPDDKLRAFSKEQIKQHLPTKPAIEWAVWNETTGRLITKSDWIGFVQIHLQLPMNEPTQIRTTLSYHAVQDADESPSMDAKPVMRLSALSRPGEKTQLNWQQGKAALNFELETHHSENYEFVHTRISGSARHDGETRVYINTAVSTRSGKPQWIARDHDGKTGMDIIIHSQLEFIDGTPTNEAILIQRNGKKERLGTSKGQYFKIEKVSNTHWLMKNRLPHDALGGMFVDRKTEPNPFDPAPKNKDFIGDFIPLNEIEAPDAIKAMLPKPAYDLGANFRKIGIKIGKDDFIGYNPNTEMLIVYTSSQEELNKVMMLFDVLGPNAIRMIFVTWDHQGRSCVAGRSGEISSIARMSMHGPSLRVFEIEPTIGENDRLATLRVLAEDNSKPEQNFLLNGAYTYVLGQWKSVAANTAPNGKQESRIRVELVEIESE